MLSQTDWLYIVLSLDVTQSSASLVSWSANCCSVCAFSSLWNLCMLLCTNLCTAYKQMVNQLYKLVTMSYPISDRQLTTPIWHKIIMFSTVSHCANDSQCTSSPYQYVTPLCWTSFEAYRRWADDSLNNITDWEPKAHVRCLLPAITCHALEP